MGRDEWHVYSPIAANSRTHRIIVVINAYVGRLFGFSSMGLIGSWGTIVDRTRELDDCL